MQELNLLKAKNFKDYAQILVENLRWGSLIYELNTTSNQSNAITANVFVILQTVASIKRDVLDAEKSIITQNARLVSLNALIAAVDTQPVQELFQ